MTKRKLATLALGALLGGLVGILPRAAAAEARSGDVVARFSNRVRGPFRLQGVTCVVDGQLTYSAVGKARELPLFNRALPPGTHTVWLQAVYDGAAGPFTYLRGFHYYVEVNHRFTVRSGETTWLSLATVERPKPTNRLANRLGVVVRETRAARTGMAERLAVRP